MTHTYTHPREGKNTVAIYSITFLIRLSLTMINNTTPSAVVAAVVVFCHPDYPIKIVRGEGKQHMITSANSRHYCHLRDI